MDLVEQDFPPPPCFEDAESSVRAQLRQRAWTTAVRQYLQALMQDADSLAEAEALLQARGIRSELAYEREHYAGPA